jgi:hypothetical protein
MKCLLVLLAALLFSSPAWAVTYDTFDPDAFVQSGHALSGGNLVVTQTSSIVGSSAQTVEGKSAGKWYMEFTDGPDASTGKLFGLCPVWGYLGGFGPGNGPASTTPNNDTGWGYKSNGAVQAFQANQTSVNATTYANGNVVGMAIDIDNKRLWFRNSAGTWIGTSGTPDPATNTGGFDITLELYGGGLIYPCVFMLQNTEAFTANFGASGFTYTPPSGFTAGWTNMTAGTYFGTLTSNTYFTGVNGYTIAQNIKAASPYVSTLTGNLSSLKVPINNGWTVPSYTWEAQIYAADGVGGLPGTRLGTSASQASTGGLLSFPFTGVSVVSGTTYWFSIDTNGAAGGRQPANSTNSGVYDAFNSTTFGSPSNPFGLAPTTGLLRMGFLAFVSPPVTAICAMTSVGAGPC